MCECLSEYAVCRGNIVGKMVKLKERLIGKFVETNFFLLSSKLII